MASSAFVKFACAMFLCMVVAAPYAEAITCGQVTANIAQCLGYLKGGPGPSAGCCSGIKSLVNAAKSSADKKTACGCLKSAAGSMTGIDYGKASGLPGKCGTSVPYSISPNTDCSKIN